MLVILLLFTGAPGKQGSTARINIATPMYEIDS